MEIYKDGERLDLENVSITRYENKIFELGEKFYKTELDFSSIKELKGDKVLLEKAFLDEFIEQIL
jgi:hypothetical protein